MIIQDYIYYRIFKYYQKKKDIPVMTGICFVFVVQFCLFFFAITAFNFLTGGMLSKEYWTEWIFKTVFYIFFLGLFLLDVWRYVNKKRRNEIERKFRTSNYNKSIQIWQIFSIPLLIIGLAFILIFTLGK